MAVTVDALAIYRHLLNDLAKVRPHNESDLRPPLKVSRPFRLQKKLRRSKGVRARYDVELPSSHFPLSTPPVVQSYRGLEFRPCSFLHVSCGRVHSRTHALEKPTPTETRATIHICGVLTMDQAKTIALKVRSWQTVEA